MPERRPARDLAPAELAALAVELGAQPFQGREAARWVFARGLRSWDAATNLPAFLRRRLAERLDLQALALLEERRAADGTRKILVGLRDAEAIEMVLIPVGERTTLCISTQVGCPVGCVFCASGLGGCRRNLSRGEIFEQFLLAAEVLGHPPTNVVVMGMGEPMLNFEAVTGALQSLCSPEGPGYSARRVTLSTAGFPERIRRLARVGRGFGLAVSLHAADPELRRRLVPHVRCTPAELVAAAQDHYAATGREPTFEVVLLAGLNDQPRHARQLVRLLRAARGTVNLIPWNPIAGSPEPLRRPPARAVQRFASVLEEGGLKVTVRRSRGRERDAACGQLRLRSTSPSRP